ncbi:hypothetical protein AB0H76_04685 [Nocardia sp. NPDC050712]|uniref:hypothetical protein n=1 Tax=Nocardia sp. NPDC050712 TaxID=3155518 RepID=UPI0034018C8D
MAGGAEEVAEFGPGVAFFAGLAGQGVQDVVDQAAQVAGGGEGGQDRDLRFARGGVQDFDDEFGVGGQQRSEGRSFVLGVRVLFFGHT